MVGDLNPDEIETLLTDEMIGRIGCTANGITYVVPISYVYDEGYIYTHSKEGMKIQMMRLNSMVCFEIDRMTDPENWQSVIAWGIYEELKGNDQKMGLQKIISILPPVRSGETRTLTREYGDAHQNTAGPYKSIIYRIKLLEKTGKFERNECLFNNEPAVGISAKTKNKPMVDHKK